MVEGGLKNPRDLMCPLKGVNCVGSECAWFTAVEYKNGSDFVHGKRALTGCGVRLLPIVLKKELGW